jgi:murein L,D-transpeptidase YcbB/YkuD
MAGLDPGVAVFYAARRDRPLWIAPDGRPGAAAQAFVALARSSELDGVEGMAIALADLNAALAALEADRSPVATARAEIAFSRSFAAYVRATTTAPTSTMLYEHDILRGRTPDVRGALEEASAAASLDEYVARMAWLHPLYAPVRQALAALPADAVEQRRVLADNLARIRGIPAAPARRYVLVDAASATLWMYENGRAVDSMRVVVGKPDTPTPMMAGYIRYAILNPYWNVPPDLVRKRIAPNALKGGSAYLRNGGYQVLSDWTPDAQVIDPSTVDWKKAAAGTAEVRVRQLPGGSNFMGKVKYEFPNKLGIYLHDTPEKNLMLKDARQFSSGCIRLEDADRLGRWLMQAPLPVEAGDAERRIDLPEAVPVYVTYLTAHAQGGQIALGPDPYRRDSAVRPMDSAAATQAARR